MGSPLARSLHLPPPPPSRGCSAGWTCGAERGASAPRLVAAWRAAGEQQQQQHGPSGAEPAKRSSAFTRFSAKGLTA